MRKQSILQLKYWLHFLPNPPLVLILALCLATLQLLNSLIFIQPCYGAPTRSLVSEETLDDFRDSLIEPLAVWFARGLLIAKLRNDFDLSLELSRIGSSEDTSNRELLAKLLSAVALQPDEVSAIRNLQPFTVEAEQIGTEISVEELLLYSKLSQMRMPASVSEFDMHWFSAQTITKRASGNIYRDRWFELPASEKEESISTIDRAELFRLDEPAVAAGFSQLYLRDASGGESFHMFSPVIGKLRQLPLSIRSDAILQKQISSNDLSVFSESLSSLSAEFVVQRELYVFFGSEIPFNVEEIKEEGQPSSFRVEGSYQLLNGKNSMARWNGDQRQFAQFAPWMPLSAFLSLRNVLIFELRPKDPFSAYGKVLLFLDQKSLLPVYKLVYSKWGSLERVVIGAWASGKHKSSESNFPVLTSVISVAANGGQATSISTRSIEFVEDYKKVEAKFPQWRVMLDPAKLAEFSMPAEEGSGADGEAGSKSKTPVSSREVPTLPKLPQ